MKIKFLIPVLCILGCGFTEKTSGNHENLSPKEEAICDSLQFDRELVLFLKNNIPGVLKQTSSIKIFQDPILDSLASKGICVLSTDQKNYEFVLNSKEKFAAKEYLIFIFTDDNNKEYVGVIKGQDELDIIKWRKSDGINHGHDNDVLVKKFKSWKTENDFWVLGVGLDYVNIMFKKPIKNVKSFAQEAYEFCPDIVDQGSGDMSTFEKEITERNGVPFWWD